MKQFEEWNMKQSTDILRNNDRLYAYVEEERESAWRAALRWAIEEETWQGTDEGGSWGISRENIEEELED